MKTSELTDVELDWAVAQAQGIELLPIDRTRPTLYLVPHKDSPITVVWEPSTNWEQGGPIIEKEGMMLTPSAAGGWIARYAYGCALCTAQHGLTPLVATMRSIVSTKLGDEIELPKELK